MPLTLPEKRPMATNAIGGCGKADCVAGPWWEWGTVHSGSVQVWLVGLDQAAAAPALDLLQDSERTEYARFVKAQDRCAFAVTRAALRCLLSDEIGISPYDLRLVRNAWGKPLLAQAQHRPGLDFSVSHAGGLSVIAISSAGPVGIDIERHHRVSEMDRIAAQVFDEPTALSLDRLPPSRRAETFRRLWTAGEACLKALGLGFAGAGGKAPVGLSRHGLPEIRLGRRPADEDGDEWGLQSLDLPSEYVGTLVARHSASATRPRVQARTTDLSHLVPSTYQ
jgi:4'-phosphopantetheinyl transferase